MRNPSSSSSSSTPAGAGAATTTNNNSSKTTPCCVKIGLKRGPWTPEEDELLANYIKKDGEGRWRTLPKRAGLLRCGKSCRLRWMNYLRPCVKRGQIAPDEEDLILRLHRLLGNRWSLIAGRIPGRTDNEIKNYWNTHLSKKLISQGIDPRTHKPLSFNPIANDTNPSDNDPKQPSSSKSKNVPVPISPNPNPSSSSSSGLEEIIKGNKGNHNAYFANTTTNLLDQEYHQTAGTNAISSNEDEDDINYCTDDVFSSFLNSLINEDVFASQHPQLQHVNHQLINGIIAPPPPPPGSTDALISSAQAFGFSGTGWENALLSNSTPSAFNHQINDPKKF